MENPILFNSELFS